MSYFLPNREVNSLVDTQMAVNLGHTFGVAFQRCSTIGPICCCPMADGGALSASPLPIIYNHDQALGTFFHICATIAAGGQVLLTKEQVIASMTSHGDTSDRLTLIRLRTPSQVSASP